MEGENLSTLIGIVALLCCK